MELFVNLLKFASLIAASAFGALGLLTKYRDDATGRITKWGKIALAGIIVSGIISFALQLLETSIAKAAAQKSERQTKATGDVLSDILSRSKTALEKQTRVLADTETLRAAMAETLRQEEATQKQNTEIEKGMRESIGTQHTLLDAQRQAEREIWRGYYPLEPVTIVYELEFPMDQPVLAGYVDRIRGDIVQFLRASREGRGKTSDDLHDEKIGFILTVEGKHWRPGDGPGEENAVWALLGQGVSFDFPSPSGPPNTLHLICDPSLQDVIVALPAKGKNKQDIQLVADFATKTITRAVTCDNPIRTGQDMVAISAIDLLGRNMGWRAATTSIRDASWTLVHFGMRFANQLKASIVPIPPGTMNLRIAAANIGLSTLLGNDGKKQ